MACIDFQSTFVKKNYYTIDRLRNDQNIQLQNLMMTLQFSFNIILTNYVVTYNWTDAGNYIIYFLIKSVI